MPHFLRYPGPFALLLAICLFGLRIPAACAEAPVDGGPIVQSLGWWVDKSGQADLGSVQQVTDWTPFAGWKSWGFGPEPVWIRLRLRGGTENTLIPWVAHVRPSVLDRVTLHDPAAGLTWHAGDAVAMDDEALGAITFTFRIPERGQARDLYLRIESTSARAINVDVLPLSEAKRRVRLQEWLYGLATSMSLIVALWAAIQWWQTRERVIGIFVIRQLFATLWAFFTLGFARVVFDGVAAPGVVSAINNTLLAGVIASVLWFMKNLFLEYQPRRFWTGAMSVLSILAPATLVLQLMGMHWQSVMILNAFIPVVLVVLVVALTTARGPVAKPLIPRRWLLTYICLYAALNSIPPLTYLGALGRDAALELGNLAYLLMDSMVMVVILHVRAHALSRRQQAVEKALVVSEEQARLMRQHSEDQGQLLAMLAHEVKTPLATMRMWMDAGPLNREAMERAIADMSRVIERCVHTGQLSDKGLKPTLQRVSVSQLTQVVIQSCRTPALVDLHAPPEEVFLKTDSHMLSIALANLLDNACKYSARGSRISVRLDATPNAEGKPGWCWEIGNAQGPSGVPDADKLFNKYYRGNHARRQSGSGLGLFLVKNLLTLLEGDIAYAPRDGDVVFRIWLPE